MYDSSSEETHNLGLTHASNKINKILIAERWIKINLFQNLKEFEAIVFCKIR